MIFNDKIHRLALFFILFTFLINNSYASKQITQKQLNAGIDLVNKNQLHKAQLYFEDLENKFPNSAIVKNNLAVIKVKLGEVNEVIALLKNAIDSNNISQTNYANLKLMFDYQTGLAYQKILSEKVINSTLPRLKIINKVPKVTVIVKTVVKEVPKIITKTVIKEVPKVIIKTVIKEVPKIITKIVIKEVPKVVTKTVIKEVPKIITKIVIKEVPKVVTKTVIKEVPKIITKIVIKEVPKIVKVNTPIPFKKIQKELKTTLTNWGNAWSNQDVKSYLDFYPNNYYSEAFNSHKYWVQSRRKRLKKPKIIEIKLSNIEFLTISNHSASIKLLQHYKSDTYKDTGYKLIVMKKLNKQWKISLEQSL